MIVFCEANTVLPRLAQWRKMVVFESPPSTTVTRPSLGGPRCTHAAISHFSSGGPRTLARGSPSAGPCRSRSPFAQAPPTPAATTGDPTVIPDWNAIAVATLSADTTKQPVEDILYTAFVQAAVYNAVVGIEGRYAPYRFHAHAPRGTSAQAAAVAAAHEILVTYVPSAQATLDADYAASLAKLPDGRAKTRGIAFGIRAADSLIRLRAHDGRNPPILFNPP